MRVRHRNARQHRQKLTARVHAASYRLLLVMVTTWGETGTAAGPTSAAKHPALLMWKGLMPPIPGLSIPFKLFTNVVPVLYEVEWACIKFPDPNCKTC